MSSSTHESLKDPVAILPSAMTNSPGFLQQIVIVVDVVVVDVDVVVVVVVVDVDVVVVDVVVVDVDVVDVEKETANWGEITENP